MKAVFIVCLYLDARLTSLRQQTILWPKLCAEVLADNELDMHVDKSVV